MKELHITKTLLLKLLQNRGYHPTQRAQLKKFDCGRRGILEWREPGESYRAELLMVGSIPNLTVRSSRRGSMKLMVTAAQLEEAGLIREAKV